MLSKAIAVLVVTGLVAVGAARRARARFDRGGWPRQDPSGLGPDRGGWPLRKVRPHHNFAAHLPSRGDFTRRIKKQAFHQRSQHAAFLSRPSGTYVSYRGPAGAYKTSWGPRRQGSPPLRRQGSPPPRRQGSPAPRPPTSPPPLPGLPSMLGGSSGRQAVAGCSTPQGFRPPGSTWPVAGCGRGVCAVTLAGGWAAAEERCEGLVQNPQYQCVMREDQSQPFPSCCPSPAQCREIGAEPSNP